MSLDPRSAPADELLQALTVGDLDPGDPAVLARFAREPVLRDRWNDLAATLTDLRQLDVGGHEATMPAPTGADPFAAVRAFRREGATRRHWLLGAVAAAALGLATLWLVQRDGAGDRDPWLGTGRHGTFVPEGDDWPRGTPLRWPAVRGAAGYRVQVEATEGGTATVWPNGEHGEWLAEPNWLPTETQRGALPERFRWRVLPFAPDGQALAPSRWVSARR